MIRCMLRLPIRSVGAATFRFSPSERTPVPLQLFGRSPNCAKSTLQWKKKEERTYNSFNLSGLGEQALLRAELAFVRMKAFFLMEWNDQNYVYCQSTTAHKVITLDLLFALLPLMQKELVLFSSVPFFKTSHAFQAGHDLFKGLIPSKKRNWYTKIVHTKFSLNTLALGSYVLAFWSSKRLRYAVEKIEEKKKTQQYILKACVYASFVSDAAEFPIGQDK